MSAANVAKLKKKAADFEQKKQFDRALSLYIQILEEAGRDLDDVDLQLFNRVGDLLQRQGNVSEALAYYEKAVDVYAERGFLNNAIALCNKVLRQSPARAAVYYKLGKISASKGFKSDAKRNFLEYADRMQKAGQVDEAFRALKEFADLCPDQDDIRLMLAEWLNKENRKSEALEQLETLYNKLEAEGRSAEARATIDRIKAIDPDVVPRPSGAYISQKSNDLVFLDLNAEETPSARTLDAESQPRSDAPPTRTPESSRVPALDGLIITFDPDVEAEATGDAPQAPLDGFEATIDEAEITLSVADAVGDAIDGLERMDEGPVAPADTGASLLSQTVEVWGSSAEPIPLLDGLEPSRATVSGVHPALSPLLDEPPMSGREFATLDLEVDTESPAEPARPRSEHDLALPSNLPLLLAEDVPVDLLAVMSTPLSSAISASRDDDVSELGIDLLSLPPIREVAGGVGASQSPVTGSHSPIDFDALLPDAARGATPREVPLVETAALLGGAPDGDPPAAVVAAAAGEEASPEWPNESGNASDDAGREDAESSDASSDEPAEAASGATARGPRDTAELVAQDGTGRATDEILAVPSEIIDEETKRSLRLEFHLNVDEAPDTWVDASTGVPGDALAFRRSVTPLDAPAVSGDRTGGEAGAASAADTTADGHDRAPAEIVASGDSVPAIDDLPSISDAAYSASGETRDINLLDEMTAPFMRHDEGHAPAAASERARDVAARGDGGSAVVGAGGGGEYAPDGDGAQTGGGDALRDGHDDAMRNALDVHALRAVVEARDATDHAAGGDVGDDVDASARPDAATELPLLDIESAADDELALDIRPYNVEDDVPGDFLAESDSVDDAPSGEAHDSGDALDMQRPDGDRSTAASTDEWPDDEVPEVLIDGEWHDEHMGDLVSGEVRAISTRSDDTPHRSNVRFDDLAAAALWVSPDDTTAGTPGAARHSAAGGGAYLAHMHTPRSTLSLGGVEAQLRRRLELDPGNVELRRQLGETLLDQGDREAGLAELDVAMRAYELAGNLDGARGVADVVLRVVPSSVRHHQKRVEYAVRANDRVRLVEAYVELADALFRSGDPDKAQVVYGRVLELSPGNARALFALGLLTTEDGPAQPTAAGPSTTRPESADSVATLFDPAAPVRAPVDDVATGHAAASDGASKGTGGSSPVAATPPAPDADDQPSGEAEIVSERATPSLDDQIDAAFATPPLAEPAILFDMAAPAGSAAAFDDAVGADHDAAALAPAPVAETAVQPSPVRFAPQDSAVESDFIDLGSWLRDDEPVRSTRMVTVESPPTGNEQADFDEMLRRFKQGVAANVDEEDYASHYDLGVAYKEMGLVDEAIAEFQKSLRGETHRVRSYEALGQCFVEKGQLQVAVTLLRRALETTGADDQQLVGVLYLLGYASEVLARHADALGYYQRVFAVDIEFRDVAQRVAAMEHVTQ